MGSTVIIAIRHDMVGEAPYDICDLIDQEMHLSDQIPKLPSSTPLLDIGSHHFRTTSLRDSGIIVSNYHDCEYSQVLMASCDFMLELNNLSELDWGKVKTERDFINQTTRAIRKNSYPFRGMTQRKGYVFQKSEPPQAGLSPSPVSFFSINTDNMDNSNTRGHIINIINFCKSGIANKETFGNVQISDGGRGFYAFNSRIDYLGTMPRNSSALIVLFHGSTRLIQIPYRQVTFDLHVETTDGFDAFVAVRDKASLAVLKSFGLCFEKRNMQMDNSPQH